MLGSRALSIYCDGIVRDATEKNTKLRIENAILGDAHAILQTVLVRHGDGQLTNIAIQDFVVAERQVPRGGEKEESDDEYMIYETSTRNDAISFRWEQIKVLAFRVSGVYEPSTIHCGRNLEFTVIEEDNAVQVILYCCEDDVVVKGKIHDLSGSIDEVYDLIDTNQIILHFFYLGTAKLDDHGNPLNFVPPTVLDDATFTVDKIFIKAHILRATLKCVNVEEAIESSEEVKELLELVKANPTHDRLCIVAEESQSLERRNMMLQASRHLVQSVEVSYPGVAGMQSVQILLENGK